jgi:hypothetical protein
MLDITHEQLIHRSYRLDKVFSEAKVIFSTGNKAKVNEDNAEKSVKMVKI